jgi:hypothetical protein
MVRGIFKKRSRISSQQFAEGLWDVCQNLYLDWEERFYEKERPIFEELPPKSEKYRFTAAAREVIIINLWIISSVLKEKGYRKVQDQLHGCYLDFFSESMSPETRKQYADDMQGLFKERYEQYYGIWNKISSVNGLYHLHSSMAGNILGEELCLDPRLTLLMGDYFTSAYETAVRVIAKQIKDTEIISE